MATEGIRRKRQLLKRTAVPRCFYTDMLIHDDVYINRPNFATIHRLDSSRGYETGNVELTSYAANRLKAALFENPQAKTHMSVEDFLNISLDVIHGKSDDLVVRRLHKIVFGRRTMTEWQYVKFCSKVSALHREGVL